jgi:hypothetical protein
MSRRLTAPQSGAASYDAAPLFLYLRLRTIG